MQTSQVSLSWNWVRRVRVHSRATEGRKKEGTFILLYSVAEVLWLRSRPGSVSQRGACAVSQRVSHTLEQALPRLPQQISCHL